MNIQTPASHKNDPDSSYEAEDRMNKSGKRETEQKIALEAVKNHPGCTSAELARETGLDRAMLARRLPELRPQYVYNGKTDCCRVNKTSAITWWVV